MADEEKDVLTKDVGSGPGCLRITIWSMVLGLLAIIILMVTVFVQKVEPWHVGLRYWLISIPPTLDFGDYGTNSRAVPEQEKANGWFLIRAGEASEPLKPGYNVIIPFVHDFAKYDCSIHTPQ